MDFKRKNEQLREEIVQLRQKLSLLENRSSQSSSGAMEDQARLQRVFAVFDRDRDGVLSGPEFQDLALQLGEVLPVAEVAACLAEIAPSGKLTVDELHRWWKTPQEFRRDDPGNRHLRLLRLKLQTRPYFELLSNICAAPCVDPAKLPRWPSARADDAAKVDVTVNMGMFDTVAASIRVVLLTDAARATQVRTELGTQPRTCVSCCAFVIQPDASEVAVRTLTEFVNDLLSSGQQQSGIGSHSVKQTTTESGQRLLWLRVVWDGSKKEIISLLEELIFVVGVRALELNLALSQKPGDPNDGFIKARLAVRAEFSRSGLDYYVAKITQSENDALWRRIVNLVSGVTGVALRLDASDLTTVLPKIAKDDPISSFQGWASLRPMLAAYMSKLNEQTAATYQVLRSVLAAPHSAFVILEDRVLEATFDNLNVSDVLPTAADALAVGGDEDEDEGPRKSRGGNRAQPGALRDSDDSSSE